MATAPWRKRCSNEVRYVPGAADARIQQPFDYPNMTVNVDRTRAAGHRPDAGRTWRRACWWSLSGSFQTSPNFYLDPKNGVTYNVAIQAPQYRLDIVAALKSLPVTGAGGAAQPERSTHRRAHRPRAARVPPRVARHCRRR